MNTIIFSTGFGMILCLLQLGQVEAEIPKGLSKYKLQNVDDLAKLFQQVPDMGLSKEEVVQLSTIGMAAAEPGATAMTLDNQAPYYTLSFTGITVKFENGKTAPFKLLKHSGSGVYQVNEKEGKINGKNTLVNWATSELELAFKGKLVELTRKTKKSTIHLTLEKL